MIFLFLFLLPSIAAENRLLERANNGDDDAVIEIYDGYFQPIYRFIRNRVQDPQLAEDITSDVFLKLMQSLGTPQRPRLSLRGWLFKVAHNELKAQYRQQKHANVEALQEWIPDPQQPDPELLAAQSFDRQRIQTVFGMLAPDQQEVLMLRFSEMMNLEETATIMNKNVNAIKALQYRAVQTLKRLLAVNEDGAS